MKKHCLALLSLCFVGCVADLVADPVEADSEALALCSPKTSMKRYVSGIFRGLPSDCYDAPGGMACSHSLLALPYALIEIPRQVSNGTTLYGDVSECFNDNGSDQICYRWFRAVCSCSAGCHDEPLPENQ